MCLFSEIDVARQCIVAGAHSDQFCQPFDSQERGTERAIDYICGNGKHGIRRRVLVRLKPRLHNTICCQTGCTTGCIRVNGI